MSERTIGAIVASARRRNGKCADCGAPNEGRSRCAKHLKTHATKERARKKKKKREAATDLAHTSGQTLFTELGGDGNEATHP